QLYAEAAAMAHGKVFTMGPTFRAEKSKTRRHLIEVWMIEPEMAFYEHDDSLEGQEQYVEYVVTNVLGHCKLDLEALGRATSVVDKLKATSPRITYTEALDLLHEKGFDALESGDDFGAPHETEIASHYDNPVFIIIYPNAIKSFYIE